MMWKVEVPDTFGGEANYSYPPCSPCVLGAGDLNTPRESGGALLRRSKGVAK